MKTAELTGADLALWVARCDPRCVGLKFEKLGEHWVGRDDDDLPQELCVVISAGGFRNDIKARQAAPHAEIYSPHVNWAQGGQLIEREKIDLMHVEFIPSMGGNPCEPWSAMMENLSIDNADWDSMSGPTPLIAAMRAYVGSKLGAEVPDEVPA